GGFFGSIFGGAPPMQRTGVPVTVRARPLPSEGRPSGEVHVGTLELRAELDRTQVATGDAVQLTVTATGTGPLHQLHVPAPSANGLRVLQPEIDDRVEAPGDLVGGTRQIRWLLVPEREGTYTLGPFEVPVFDPRSGSYSVARAPALVLTAAGNPTAPIAEPRASAPDDRSEAEPPRLELGPIRSRSALSRSRRTLLDAPWVPWAFGAGPLSLVLALLVRLARRRAASGAASSPKNARREAKRRLAAAERHAAAGEPREFYAAIAQALKELLEAKLGRPVGSLTHVELARTLVARGMQEELVQRVVDELESCDFARFSAAGIRGEEMESCLARTKELLRELDRFTAKEDEP
ncbi:MAG TPA: BatD family protein, partial [Sandaracinaceae bacterium]